MATTAAKRTKLDVVISDDETTSSISSSKMPELVELSESFIAERLSVEIATELVMDSMV